MKYLELGKGIVISERAYATIVYYALSEIDAVSVSKNKSKEITERQLRQLVSLNVSKYGVEIDIHVELCYGHNLEIISKKIQHNVMEVINNNVGYEPACVNVHVTNVAIC